MESNLCDPIVGVWQRPTKDTEIRLDKSYIVKTNGENWGDFPMRFMVGAMLKHHLKPEIERGKVLWFAEILEPPQQ